MGDAGRQHGNAAIPYDPKDFAVENGRLLGRQSASASFIAGFARHARIDALYCYANRQADAAQFASRALAAGGPERPVYWVPADSPQNLAEIGCLFVFHPRMREHAFLRRAIGQRAFSLCGIIHTLASQGGMDAVADWLIAPFQPWDALICTSTAGRQAVERQLAAVGAYLAERTDGRPPALPRLETIPLGIDCAGFAHDPASRAHWRQRFGIAEEDVAALYLGRLSAHAKAHPEPMYMALERAARRTGRRLHLIQAGWFHNKGIERNFREQAARLAPSVTMHFVTPLEGETYRQIWSAADFFLSLSDNIQETFGLTPVEAMAAGLPAVVSDWDGYRDTVRDGIDGFRIPTLAPGPGAGGDLALRHAIGMDRYDLYIGKASKFVAVDIEACAEACLRLIEDAALRRRMGDAGQRRAREAFDWSVIVPAYQALWAELAAIRQGGSQTPEAAPETMPVRPDAPHNPWRLDPFDQFAGYPALRLTPDFRIRLAADGMAALDLAYASPNTGFAALALPTAEEAATLCRLLAESGEMRVLDLLMRLPAERRPLLFRGLAWLAKYGVVILRPAQSLPGKAERP